MSSEPDSSEVLTADYGNFNPRFMGVSLSVNSPEDFSYLLRYWRDEIKADPAQDITLHQAALRSVPDHERRHYFDFLLSPYSMILFRLRLQALVNASGAIRGLQRATGSVIPIPISQWVLLSEEERQDERTEWIEMVGRQVDPVALPSWSEDDFDLEVPPVLRSLDQMEIGTQVVSNVFGAVRAYRQMDQLTEGLDPLAKPFLRPPYVHEASALTVQLAAVWSDQGVSSFLRFAHLLLDSSAPQAKAWARCFGLAQILEDAPKSRRHSGAASDLVDDFQDTILRPVRRIPTITTWALFGSHLADGSRGCPASRLAHLAQLVVGEPHESRWTCNMDDRDSITEMWDYWDRRTSTTPWRELVASNVALTVRGTAAYKRMLRAWDGDQVSEAIVHVLKQVQEDQQVAVHTLTHSLQDVIDPFRFVNAPLERLPVPDARFEFRGWGLRPASIGTTGRAIPSLTASGEAIVTGWAFSPHQDANSKELLDQKLILEAKMLLCDELFSRSGASDGSDAGAATRELEKLTGKRIFGLV